jgi:phosphoribosylamine--glycine ligase
MKILVVGSGGREHALVWKLAKSKLVKKIFAAPGNAGIYRQAELVNIKAEDVEGLVRFAREKEIDLTLVGPEIPLALGIVDRFNQENLKIVGPTREAAQLESSKVWAKQFMRKYHIPTASFLTFDNLKDALKFVKGSMMPLAIKADGLAAGKGVIIAGNAVQAESAVREMMQKRRFGDAGTRIVVEKVLTGEEASVMALTDGKNIQTLIPSQDHKQIGDNDTGPNTGGMGAYAPVPFMSDKLRKDIHDLVLAPAVEGLAAEGFPFKGCLYAGLMLTDRGPRVIEFNCRFGDPEAQAILPLLKTDLAELLLGTVEGDLDTITPQWEDAYAVCVVLASGGYPGIYEKGKVIEGLMNPKSDNPIVFHAGTRFENRKILTSGGRVLGVTAKAETIEEAIQAAYNAAGHIEFEGKQMRTDIGMKAINTKLRFLE